MKKTGKKLLTLLLALVMVLGMLAVPALAADPFAYEGDDVNFINADGDQFGMFTRMDGSSIYIVNDDVVIHYVTKSNVRSSDQTLVYTSIHWGSITDTLTADVPANADGSFDITLSKENCGKAIPVAPVKPAGGTTSSQYYLAIPAASKLEDRTPVVEPFAYSGDDVNFINADGGQFGMFTRMDGTTAVINGDNVVIHYVTKSNVRSSDQTLVYTSIHWGPITDTLTADVPANADGSFDITLSKENCGKAIPVAPVKPAGGTTSSQYYLAIPAADKLTDVTPAPEPVTLTDGTYQLPELSAGPSAMFNHFVADSRQLIVNGDNATVRFITDGSTSSIQKYSRIALGRSSELVSTAYQPELAAGVTVIDGVLQPDDGTGKAKYLFEISLGKTAVEALLSDTIAEDVYITVWNNQGAASNGNVPGWYKASDDIYLSLGALGSKLDSGTDEPGEPLTINALVSISVAGELVSGADGTVVAAVPVLVTDLDNSGDINIDETMVAAHEAFYNGGAAAGYASSVGSWGLGMDMLWGDTSYAFGYYVNNASAWSLADPVVDGDHVQAFVYQDTQYYSDAYSYFDKLTAQTADGSVTLTLSSTAYDMNSGAMVASPYAGATITIDGEATGFVTDSDGKVTVSFSTSGTHLVSAVGKDSEILVPPVCLVTAAVTEPLTINALVSISVAGELVSGADGSLVAAVPVLAADLDNSGDVNIDEVLYAAHEACYPGGAAAGYASAASSWGLSLTTLWGDTSGNFGYYVDNAMAMSLADPVTDGAHVQAWVYKDSQYWSDAYAYFDKLSADAPDGSVTLTLSSASFDENWNPVFAAYAGATVTIDGEATGFVTDSAGKVTVTFDRSGTYVVSALAKDGEVLVPPVCLVTATAGGSGGGGMGRIDLEITNNTSMFKAVTAYIETENGVSELVMALSGSGYHELFKGTYEKAVANGSNTAAWIHGYENSDGKWEFRIPLADGESYIPLVAISNSYYTKYLAGENELERAFFARELEIDWDAGTLVTGDYSGETITVSVSSSVDDLQVAGSTQMTVVGGPNSNNFSISFSLKLLDDTYDQLTYPTVVGSALGTQTAALSGGAFEIEMINAPKRTAFENGVPCTMTLRSSGTGKTLTIDVTIDVLAKTIDIEAGSEEAGADTGSAGSTTPASAEAEAVAAGLDVTAETEDGKAAAALDAAAVAAALEEEAEAEILSVKVESKDADTVELTLDAEALKAVAEGGTALRVETEQGAVTLSKDELSKLAEDGGEVAVTLSASEDGSTTLNVTVNGESADVTVKAALPAVEDSQVLVLVKEDGTEEVIRKSLVEDGTAYAYLPAGSTVRAVDNSMEFEDVGDSWYADYVDFVSSHGLFIGVSETEFAPQDNMTRAMLVTVLFRLEAEPDGFTGLKFGDVKDGSWYADAVAWASETGLVNGTDRGFEPNENISREQIATILYRYAQYVDLDTGAKGDVTRFSDGSEVSSWASDAMTWAVGVGLFEGDGAGSLNPKGDASRAEVSALMLRLVKLLVR